MSNGIRCICAAYGECECACGADWTDQRVYDLQEEVAILQEAVNALLSMLPPQTINDLNFLAPEVLSINPEVLKKINETTN
jgi:hypothetical protein